MPLGVKEGLGPNDFVLDGNPALQKMGHNPPQFSAHAYRGQTTRWIKIPLGREVSLCSGDTVLDGDPPKRTHPLIFLPMSIVAKRSPISATAELL